MMIAMITTKFDSFASFIDMGGYGFYVWLSFGVSFGLLIGLTLATKMSNNAVKTQIAKQIKREQKLKLAAEKQRLSATNNSNEVISES